MSSAELTRPRERTRSGADVVRDVAAVFVDSERQDEVAGTTNALLDRAARDDAARSDRSIEESRRRVETIRPKIERLARGRLIARYQAAALARPRTTSALMTVARRGRVVIHRPPRSLDARAPRARRVRTRSGSRGSPGRPADDPDLADRPRAER